MGPLHHHVRMYYYWRCIYILYWVHCNIHDIRFENITEYSCTITKRDLLTYTSRFCAYIIDQSVKLFEIVYYMYI